jgi:hypothetical protein
MNKVWAVALLAALAGCSSGADDPRQAFCVGFGNGATFAWTQDAGYTVANPLSASDGDLFTASSIVPASPAATSGSATLSATAAATLPAGATVGVFVTQPGGLTQTANRVRTLLNNVEQETTDNSNPNRLISVVEEGSAAAAFLGLRTTMAFDEVEFTTTNTWNSGTPVYYVYDVCSDGGNE